MLMAIDLFDYWPFQSDKTSFFKHSPLRNKEKWQRVSLKLATSDRIRGKKTSKISIFDAMFLSKKGGVQPK